MFRLIQIWVLAALLLAAGPPTALDRYVQAPDSSYRFEVAASVPGKGYTSYLVDLTSQTWLTPREVDRTEWKHWLLVVKPDQVGADIGMLMIGGGNNDRSRPKAPDAFLVDTALATQSVVAELRMVPNQPLVFGGDGNKRVEDDLIAYAWDKYLRTGDANWLPRLPMTKSAVRAMDAITALCASPRGGGVKVARFVVTGGSKRGWTTWTTAAVDKRVVAIAPIVIDLLNMEKSFIHHWRCYGFWAPAVKDYESMGLMDQFRSPRFRSLMKIVEPYSYRDRLVMPKFILNSAGDQFFLPDSSQFYFDALKGEKHLRYVPNSDHSLRGSDARESLAAFYESVIRNRPRPRISWKLEKDGAIRVKARDRPVEVKLWQATNPEKRDFRLMSIGKAYKSSLVSEQGGGTYTARVETPARGWTAYFMELTFSTGGKYPLKLTTPVRVVPDRYPFPPPKGVR